ncbi:hypothetical protein QR685DRAFT_313253 [Neurospora intermedia]|uniref:Uncharacterized protein n=1 Tax=Neurospora intermedia TaxID=5142 RepID=A0ABR3D7V2_NEUIN
MPSPSSDETLSANTFNSLVDTTTAGAMTSISLTSLESNPTITLPSQNSENAVGKREQQSHQYFNHHPHPHDHHDHHVYHSPSCSISRSPPLQSSLDQPPQQEDQQKAQDQSIEPGQDPEQQEQSQPQQQQLHKQYQRPTSPPPSSSSSSSSSAAAAQAHPNPSTKSKTALNEFITRSRSSTLYTPSDNERDDQIRIAILTRCLDMEDRFQVQAAQYWGRLQ